MDIKLDIHTGPRWACIAHLITRQVSSQLAFRFKRKKIKMAAMVAVLNLQAERF